MSSEGVSQKPRLSNSEVAELQLQVSRILGSSAFHSSARCSDFLRYVTSKVTEGEYDALHERAIAMDLFGKPSTYDPAGDSLVRTKASEVRRRLAQYYSEPGRQRELRLTLPAGSYALERHWPQPEDAEAAAAASKKRTPIWPVAAVVATFAVAAMVLLPRVQVRPSPLDLFWRPALESQKPVMLTLGNANVYVLSPDALARAARPGRGGTATAASSGTVPPTSLSAGDFISQQGHYVGAGGAQAVLNYTEYFARLKKEVFLRTGVDYSFSDLRNYPTVMLGAFSSEWTLLASRNLPIHFANINGRSCVVDTASGARWTVDPYTDTKNLTDYVIVARILPSSSETGELAIIAAGVTQYGAITASEFLTRPGHFERIVEQQPPGWESKNIEILLRSRVIAGTPAPPEVVSVRFW